MNILTTHLFHQTQDATQWANQLISTVDSSKWFTAPDVLNSNIAWQLGHLTLSQYYYTVVLLAGPDKTFADTINLKKYSELFAKGINKQDIVNTFTVDDLKNHWQLISDTTAQILQSLNDDELREGIVKMPKEHPFVKTKLDAVAWNIKHTMWHCGQIATLKRVIDQPHDFGL